MNSLRGTGHSVIKVVIISISILAGTTLMADVNGEFIYEGLMRTYTIHIPPQYNEEDSFTLVINLHGGNGNAPQQASMSQMNTKADTEGFLVVYPNGTQLPAGYTGWNAGEWAESAVDDVGFIGALIDTVVDNYRVDTLRIYATGFSLGAMMCHTLACEMASRIAAVAPVEGGLTLDDWDACQPQRLIPVMHFHHRNDETVPYYGDPELQWAPPIDSVMRHWADENGCDIGPDTFYNEQGALRQRWTRSDDSCEVVFWTLEQGNGHQWPGSPAGSQELSANDEMWDFFMAHPIPMEEEPEPGIEDSANDRSYRLDACCNLASKTVTVNFSLEKEQHVDLALFDVMGCRMTNLLNETLQAGEHRVILDATALPSGVYFCRLSTPEHTRTQPVQLLK